MWKSLVFAIVICSLMIMCSCYNDYTKVGETSELITAYDRQLISLSDGTNISGKMTGSLFLSSAYIDEELVYRYYYKTEDGGYKLDWVKAKHVTIYEDATSETARYEFRYYYKYNVDKQGGKCWDRESYECKFHIPPNSIIRSFELDTK